MFCILTKSINAVKYDRMAVVKITCAHCGKTARKEAGAVSRSRRIGMRLFCNRKCAGIARRKGKTKAQIVEAKRVYDARRRIELADRLKAEKAAYHKRTYDPAKAAAVRAKRMPRHVEYCRRPEYRAKKQDYDKQRRLKAVGEFAECVEILDQLNTEILSRMSKYEIRMANGYYDKQNEKRKQRRLENAA